VKRLALLVAALLAVASPAAAARQVGPGPVDTVVTSGRFHVELHLTPNVATRTGTVSVRLRDGSGPIVGARIRLTVKMLSMNMGSFALALPERSAGTYTSSFPVVGMGGRWGFRLDVTPPRGRSFSVSVADRMLR
jgi:hypothetical protein